MALRKTFFGCLPGRLDALSGCRLWVRRTMDWRCDHDHPGSRLVACTKISESHRCRIYVFSLLFVWQ